MPMNRNKHCTVQEANERIRRYCAYQERSHQEVVRKLSELGMQAEARDHIIAELISEGFLNDERFGRAFALGKFRNKQWGRLRIERELKARGLSEYNIRNAFQEIESVEYGQVFEETARKGLRTLQGLPSPEIRRKLWNYLSYRGWEADMITHFIEREL